MRQSVDVEVPVSTAYDQWAQLQDFPRFMFEMQGVQRVRDERITWVAASGSGAVRFIAVGPERTQVQLTLVHRPHGVPEHVTDEPDGLAQMAVAELDRFKQFVESGSLATVGHTGTNVEADPASSVLNGYPGVRIRHTTTGGQGPDDPAAGILTGYPAVRTPGHVDPDGPCSGSSDTTASDRVPEQGR